MLSEIDFRIICETYHIVRARAASSVSEASRHICLAHRYADYRFPLANVFPH